MMTNHADGIEVRSIAQRVAIGNYDNVVVVLDR
jgi:hypothetical protein